MRIRKDGDLPSYEVKCVLGNIVKSEQLNGNSGISSAGVEFRKVQVGLMFRLPKMEDTRGFGSEKAVDQEQGYRMRF